MKKQKGFTLIELLAVIVILAIIALIATPMIMGVIDSAKKGAAEDATYGYIESVEGSTVYALAGVSGYKEIGPGVHKIDSEMLKDIKTKGSKPTEGWVAVDTDGSVVAAFLKFKSYNGYVGYTPELHANATLSENSVTITVDSSTTVAAAKEAIETALNK